MRKANAMWIVRAAAAVVVLTIGCGGSGSGGVDVRRMATVMDFGTDDGSGVLGTMRLDSSLLRRGADGTHHVLVTYHTFNSGYTNNRTAHYASTDGEVWTLREGFDFAKSDPVDAIAQGASVARGVASDEAGNLLSATFDEVRFWDTATGQGAKASFAAAGRLPGHAERLVKVGAGAWDAATYWLEANAGFMNDASVHGLGLGPLAEDVDHFYSSKAAAYGDDGSLSVVFFNSARLSGGPREGFAGATAFDDTITDYRRGDRQFALYLWQKARPLATEGRLRAVDTSSLDLLRDVFGRDFGQTFFRAVAAEVEPDGTVVAVFTVNEALTFFAAVREDAGGALRLDDPVFLDGRFLTLTRFPDTGQPIVVSALDSGRIQVLPVADHAVGEAWALDASTDLSPWIAGVSGDHVTAEPGGALALLLPYTGTAEAPANRLVYGSKAIRRAGRIVPGSITATAPAWHSPAAVTLEVPAGAKSYAWCFGDGADGKDCVTGGARVEHTYVPGGTQASFLATARATGSDGVVSVYARRIDVQPGNALGWLEPIGTWEAAGGTPRVVDGAHYYALDPAADPMDPQFQVLDTTTGAEVGRVALGFIDLLEPHGMFPADDRVYVAFQSAWAVVDATDPAAPRLVETVPNPLFEPYHQGYSTLRFEADGTVLIANQNNVMRYDRKTRTVLWGPIGLTCTRLYSLGDERYFAWAQGMPRVYRRDGDAFVLLRELAGDDVPTFVAGPADGPGAPLVFAWNREDSATLREATFGADGTPAFGRSIALPFALGSNFGYRYQDRFIVPSSDGPIAIVDLAAGKGAQLSVPGLHFWQQFQGGWLQDVSPVFPDGRMFASFREYDTIDRAHLTQSSPDLDVTESLAKTRVRAYRLAW